MMPVMSKAEVKRNETFLQGIIDRIGEAATEFEAGGVAAEAGGYLAGMVEYGGYPALQGEAWTARIKKAKQARVRQLKPAKAAKPALSTNQHGLDVHYFRTKMQRMLRGLGSYTPDEFARECARMSVTADATVLNEPEFDRYR